MVSHRGMTFQPEMEEAVLARTDPIALKSLLEHVFDSDTLDDFAEAL